MSGKIGNYDLFEDENNNEMELENLRQSHEVRMRYCKLCDEVGLIYEDIEKFVKWLKQPTLEQIKKYKEIDDKFFELFDTEEIKVLRKKYSKLCNEDWILFDKYMEDGDKLHKIEHKLYFSENTLQDKEIVSLEKEERKWKKQEKDDEKKLEEIKKMEKEIDEKIEILKKERWKELNENKEIKELYEKRTKFFNSRYKKDNTLTENEEIFNEFRKNHYNTEVERLFRRLGIDYLTRIPNEEIKNSGTVEDYIDFIEDVILDLDKLYLDDYDTYYFNVINNKNA